MNFDYAVLDESQARVLQGEAFTAALERFCAAPPLTLTLKYRSVPVGQSPFA